MTALGLSAALVMVASWIVATPAFAASTLGLDKEASVDEASPGEDFKYTLTPRCSGLTESCINAVLTDVVPVHRRDHRAAGEHPRVHRGVRCRVAHADRDLPDSAAGAQPGRLGRAARRLVPATSNSG